VPSVFLSHTSVDKPFVEKLGKDLKKLGVNVWFDKWEIKVGDSITWKIEDGIRENEYLAIVLSPEALNSSWVKSEISAAWVKQMNTKKIVLLPILYRDCNIPLLLADRKYADFRKEYSLGLAELASVLGIKEIETIDIENWRRFVKSKNVDWKIYRKQEFERLVTVLVDRAIEYNWSSWVGGTKNLFSITFSAYIDRERKKNITIKLSGKTYAYLASFEDVINPNNLRSSCFSHYIGNSINECEEFLWRQMEDFKNQWGIPTGKSVHFTERFSRAGEVTEAALELVKKFNWYKGNKK